MAITRKDLLRELMPGLNALFDVEYSLFKKYGQDDEVDKHKYQTEAKKLPIKVCRDMWIIKYGNEAVSMELVNEQDPLIWEIGNRLWWNNDLEYDKERDTFKCRS
jgi:hypothetical protein